MDDSRNRTTMGSPLGSQSLAAMSDTARATIASVVARGETPGLQWAVGRLHGPAEVFAAGEADTLTHRPVTPATIFLSSSMTKLITAILVLQLVDRGQLSLDAPLATVLPELRYTANVTVGKVLAHASGLPNPNPMNWVHSRETAPGFDEGRALDLILAKFPNAPGKAGARYRYSNLGYWLLGRLLERLGEQSYEALVQQRIAKPLGLDRASLTCAFPPEDRMARGYVRKLSPIYPVVRLLLPWQLCPGAAGRWAPFVDLTMNGAAYGGLFATCSAYLAVLMDILGDAPVLLSPTTRETLFQSQTFSGGPGRSSMAGLKLGMCSGHRFAAKAGGGPGFSSNLRIYPDIGLASVWMRNCLSFSERAIEGFSDRLDAILLQSGWPHLS